MYGWHGRLLRVNLTNGTFREEPIAEEDARRLIGGRGLAIKYLFEGMDPRADPLSPENLLIMATGPLTSTPAPTGNRYMVVCKSPLTGALTRSNSGGIFPTMLKRSGYDLVIFEGKAPRPVYLYINDRHAELRDAAHLWGRETQDTDAAIKAETDPKACVACIGPAGENGVLYAAIVNDCHRAAARSGVGAVMGAKNLKAVAAAGTMIPALYDEKAMRAVVREAVGELAAAIKKGHSMRIYGTSYVPDVTNAAGVFPTHNFPVRPVRRHAPDQRPVPQGQLFGAQRRLLRLPAGLRPDHRGQGRGVGRRVCRQGRRSRVRDDRLAGQRLRHRQHGGGHQGQLSVQRAGPRHHLHGPDRLLRHGDVHQGDPDRGRHRPAAALWRRRWPAGDDPAHCLPAGVWRRAGPGELAAGAQARSPRDVDHRQEARVRRRTTSVASRAWASTLPRRTLARRT